MGTTQHDTFCSDFLLPDQPIIIIIFCLVQWLYSLFLFVTDRSLWQHYNFQEM